MNIFDMRKVVFLLAAMLMSLALAAQTPGEILDRMSKAMEQQEAEGLAMTMDMKIPILGTYSTRVQTLGGKSRMEVVVKGRKEIVWEDGNVTYAYDSAKNTLTITELMMDAQPLEGDESLGLAKSVTEGYDVQLLQETDGYWDFRCDKSKDNHEKNAPKRIDISVCKDSYLLREMKTSLKGISVMLKDIAIGVKEEDVTFDMSRFKDAKIVDKRGEEKKQK